MLGHVLEDGQQGTDPGSPSEAEKVPAIVRVLPPFGQDCHSASLQLSQTLPGLRGLVTPPHPQILLTFLRWFR